MPMGYQDTYSELKKEKYKKSMTRIRRSKEHSLINGWRKNHETSYVFLIAFNFNISYNVSDRLDAQSNRKINLFKSGPTAIDVL